MKPTNSFSIQMEQSSQIKNNQSIFFSNVQNKSSIISQMTPQQVMKNMSQQHKIILRKMNKLDQLNIAFQQKQQIVFLKTFLNIMDRMSNQLTQYQQKIRDIDQQIAKDQKCVALANQMNFFRNQCLQLRKQYQEMQGQVVKQKIKNQVLESKKNQLHNGLFKKSKECYKYKTRANSLQLCYQQNSFVQEKLKQKQIKLRTAYAGSLYSKISNAKYNQKINKQVDINYRTVNVNANRHISLNTTSSGKRQFFNSMRKSTNFNNNQSNTLYQRRSLNNKSVNRKIYF